MVCGWRRVCDGMLVACVACGSGCAWALYAFCRGVALRCEAYDDVVWAFVVGDVVWAFAVGDVVWAFVLSRVVHMSLLVKSCRHGTCVVCVSVVGVLLARLCGHCLL